MRKYSAGEYFYHSLFIPLAEPVKFAWVRKSVLVRNRIAVWTDLA
ncbi:hypothetical protein RCC89_18285 [Cytophagaceae bacterium ABcell3]|nr:hypothetical protein RCC89_18285 [Cytophagaceae bacterium ABcell3]